jgi:hypothetical protein
MFSHIGLHSHSSRKTLINLIGSFSAMRNSRVLRALVDVAGTRIAELMLDASRALGFQAFSHWFHPMDLQRVQRKSGLNRDAPFSVEVLIANHRSDAAWPA